MNIFKTKLTFIATSLCDNNIRTVEITVNRKNAKEELNNSAALNDIYSTNWGVFLAENVVKARDTKYKGTGEKLEKIKTITRSDQKSYCVSIHEPHTGAILDSIVLPYDENELIAPYAVAMASNLGLIRGQEQKAEDTRYLLLGNRNMSTYTVSVK